MERLLLLLLALFIPYPSLASQDGDLNQALKSIDAIIKNNESYVTKREARIDTLYNAKAGLLPNTIPLYDANMQLYREYKAFKCDSAILYLNSNIEIARHLNDIDRLIESKLLLISLLEKSGLYKEAADVAESIDRDILPSHFTQKYYDTYSSLYHALDSFTQDPWLKNQYRAISYTYRDSLLSVLDKEAKDDESLIILETYYLDNDSLDEALKINEYRLSLSEQGTPEHAMAAYHRSLIEAAKGDHEKVKYYLTLSALSDLMAAIRDYASLWMLAEILYVEGDIERSYNYIRFSWNDTQLYNARHRSVQTAGLLSLIDQTYQKAMQKKNETLRNFTILISILVILLSLALLYIYKQMKKLSDARNDLQYANKQLKELNEELKQSNINLRISNDSLSESNMIKEKYIGRFINLCSVYIDKLDTYRRMTYKKIITGQIDQLKQLTGSSHTLDNELKELYTNFDTTFLQLFPDFVEKFNALLLDEETIVLKKEELLNTELRIYALIRLGIDDSTRIAEFLRYSLNTIYNYRAKVRNKAKVSRDDFDTLVKQIK